METDATVEAVSSVASLAGLELAKLKSNLKNAASTSRHFSFGGLQQRIHNRRSQSQESRRAGARLKSRLSRFCVNEAEALVVFLSEGAKRELPIYRELHVRRIIWTRAEDASEKYLKRNRRWMHLLFEKVEVLLHALGRADLLTLPN
jgi:hypothetical protein